MILIFKRVLGVLCVILGLLALVTPLTPGAWLMLVGAELLGLSFLLPKKLRDEWEGMKARLMARLRRKKQQ